MDFSKYLMIVFSFLITSCNLDNISKNNPSVNDSSLLDLKVKKEIAINDSLFSIEKEISYENYSMKIVTVCQKDSVIPDEKNLFNPIVISQDFSFYHGNQYINSLSIPIRTIEQEVYGGQVKKMLDCVFFEVKIVKRKDKSIVYYILGYGGCNGDCPSCCAVISLEGKLMAIDYRTETEIIKKEGMPEYLNEIANGKINGEELKGLLFYP